MAFQAVEETDKFRARRRERSFNTAVLRLAYERHFGTPFSLIPEGTTILFRGKDDTRFRLVTKVSESYDSWVSQDPSHAGALMAWTAESAVVFHFGPGENGAVKIFDSLAPLTEVLYDLDVDKFIINFEENYKC